MKIFLSLVLSLSSGLLFVLSWPPYEWATVFLFTAFVPLFFVASITQRFFVFFVYAYSAMLVWNVGTIYWLVYSTLYGGIFTILVNALLMCFPLCIFYIIYKKHSDWGLLLFIPLWLSYEYFHYHWEVHFPWLTLGNGLAAHTLWVQWYEYTGVAGGSLWVLVVNVSIFKLCRIGMKKSKIFYRYVGLLCGIVIVPLCISFLLYAYWGTKISSIKESSKDNAVIVQPNIACYQDKFTVSARIQLSKLIRLSEEKMDSNTRFVIWPETAFPDNYWENKSVRNNFYNADESLRYLTEWLDKNLNIRLVTGMTTYREVARDTAEPAELRSYVRSVGDTIYYIIYNTAALVGGTGVLNYYHKTKLVPGVEAIPYAAYLQFMNYFMVDMGGITGTLGTDKEPHNFSANGFSCAPLICYESIYGDYVSNFSKRGADILFIVTNDGWWENTKGYRQHALYGLLRAIENRKYIFRSANTGISYVADPRGEILLKMGWDTAGALSYPLYPSRIITFYMRYPNLLYNAAVFFLVIYFVSLCILYIREKSV